MERKASQGKKMKKQLTSPMSLTKFCHLKKINQPPMALYEFINNNKLPHGVSFNISEVDEASIEIALNKLNIKKGTSTDEIQSLLVFYQVSFPCLGTPSMEDNQH